ncbi:MAG: hypothetical protein HC848_02910 [Limnobacter sp.]|nr:hypothetical protein [Limnobacter sp.]
MQTTIVQVPVEIGAQSANAPHGDNQPMGALEEAVVAVAQSLTHALKSAIVLDGLFEKRAAGQLPDISKTLQTLRKTLNDVEALTPRQFKLLETCHQNPMRSVRLLNYQLLHYADNFQIDRMFRDYSNHNPNKRIGVEPDEAGNTRFTIVPAVENASEEPEKPGKPENRCTFQELTRLDSSQLYWFIHLNSKTMEEATRHTKNIEETVVEKTKLLERLKKYSKKEKIKIILLENIFWTRWVHIELLTRNLRFLKTRISTGFTGDFDFYLEASNPTHMPIILFSPLYDELESVALLEWEITPQCYLETPKVNTVSAHLTDSLIEGKKDTKNEKNSAQSSPPLDELTKKEISRTADCKKAREVLIHIAYTAFRTLVYLEDFEKNSSPTKLAPQKTIQSAHLSSAEQEFQKKMEPLIENLSSKVKDFTEEIYKTCLALADSIGSLLDSLKFFEYGESAEKQKKPDSP